MTNDNHVMFLDINMPKINGVEAAKIIRKDFPDIKILMLTMHNEGTLIKKIMELGVLGYILKDRGEEDFVEALETIAEGKEYCRFCKSGKAFGM